MPYLTVPQIEAAMTSLESVAPAGVCRKIALPHPTVSEGMGPTTYSYLKIANGTGSGRVAVLAVAGMHAREWAQPDAVISFARRLLEAYVGGKAFVIPAYTDRSGNTHGPVSVPAAKVADMVDRLDILLVPCANPDGRAFAQKAKANHMWRKTRSPRPPSGANPTVGVDPNRNFDIAWDFNTYYDAAFPLTGELSASKDPADDAFIGKPRPAPNNTHPDNEPEARNLVWILDNHPVTYSIDLHSYSMLLMYPWGIEQNGSVAAQHFRNTAFDHKRDGTLGNGYSEYFPNTAPARLRHRHEVVAGAMRDAVAAATGRTYKVGGIADTIYPATGTFADYHFSRQFTVAGSPPVHAFAAEFGDSKDNFQPRYGSAHGYPKIEREVHAALITLLDAALPPKAAPASGSGGGSGSGGSGGGSGGGGGGGGGGTCLLSVAATVLVGGAAHLETLRRGRGRLLAGSRTHRPMVAADRCYRGLSARLVPHLVQRRWAMRLVAHAVLAPVAALTGLALGRSRDE